MRMAAMLTAALLLGSCAAKAPQAEGEPFSLRPFTAAGTLTWGREEYRAALSRGADGVLTVSLQNARFAEPVVLFAGAQSQGMRLGALSLELPAQGGPPENAAASADST